MWALKTSWKPSVRRIDGGSGPRRGNMRPGRRHGLRTPARKANEIGYRTQTTGPENQKRRPGCRRGSRLTSRKANKFGFLARTPGREIQRRRHGRRHGLRTPARKANRFGFRTQTTGPENQNRRLGCRHANEEACIVKQLLTMQASSISIVYCSPCELSSV